MVKGLSRRAVLVRFPEAGLFEEAVFVVRDAPAAAGGLSAEQVLAEACQIARNHAPKAQSRRLKNTPLPPLVYMAAGGMSVGLVWLLTALFG